MPFEIRIWSNSMIESYGTSLTKEQFDHWEDNPWDLLEYLQDKESYGEEVPELAEIEYEFDEMGDYYQEILANLNYTTIDIVEVKNNGDEETIYDGSLSEFISNNGLATPSGSDIFDLANKETDYMYQCDVVGSGCIAGIDVDSFDPKKLSFQFVKLPNDDDLYLSGMDYEGNYEDVSEHNFQFTQKSSEVRLTQI